MVVQKKATAVSVTIKAEGNVNDYAEGSPAKAKLEKDLATLFKCLAPCILTATVTAASINVKADMAIPAGSAGSSAALVAVQAAASAVTPASASSGLNLQVKAGGISPPQVVQTTVSVAVAPPPPSPPSPPPSPTSPPSRAACAGLEQS